MTRYDPANNVTQLLDPRGEGATHTYDAANRLLAELFTDGQRHTYTYDNVANRLTAASAAGVYTSVYDPRNQEVSLTEWPSKRRKEDDFLIVSHKRSDTMTSRRNCFEWN